MSKQIEFARLMAEVAECTACDRMCGSARVLNHACGELDSPVMFVGEAPGRLGADVSAIPFHGDKAGHNFEELLAHAGLTRYSTFITNAVLCNPKDQKGNNASPLPAEIARCAAFLRKQIDLVQPSVVVTLGAVALKSCALIEQHNLSLASSVRTRNSWYGRSLIPLYHPGQRAMIHRSMANQRSDYQFVADILKGGTRRKGVGNAKADVIAVADMIVSSLGSVTYFGLHKLLYLIEVAHVKAHGTRFTSAYFVRQKDGPYCVDLHPAKLKYGQFHLVGSASSLRLIADSRSDLFSQSQSPMNVIVAATLAKYGSLPNSRLKTAAYMTSPMRSILRQEASGLNLYNSPIRIE